MPGEIDSSYERFTELKVQALSLINQDNAESQIENSKKTIQALLNTLKVENIVQVEALYLEVAKLANAICYVLATTQARTKQIAFDDAFNGLSAGDIYPFLVNIFRKNSENLNKILTIETTYKPAKQAWTASHCQMLFVATTIQAEQAEQAQLNSLRDTLALYREHLQAKLAKNGMKGDLDAVFSMPEEGSSFVQKMYCRYNAIRAIEARISENKSRLTNDDIDFVHAKLKICINNKPQWTERPFLQKMFFILGFGIMPLYKLLFSKEKALQEKIHQVIEPPKIGK